MTFLSEHESTEHIYSVTEITQEIKELLENSFPPVWIQGEISNFTHHSSGHMYFSLKDDNAQIAAVMWRSRNAGLIFAPQDGMKVNALGSLKVYEKRGTYQLDVMRMIPAGAGELQIAFEQLKIKLRDEGLFDEALKKPLPSLPSRIGIVTSPMGAAIHDLLNVLKRRYPLAEVILRPAQVQGVGAAEDIAEAIAEFNQYGHVDLLIIGRGGGSIEDLWAFNEEVVARAIHRSHIPVVSAVGHEVDFTIADFVADVRAATPSAAAELVVPDAAEMGRHLLSLKQRLAASVLNIYSHKKDRLYAVLSSYGLRRPLDFIVQYRQQVDDIVSSCGKSLSHHFEVKKNRLMHLLQLTNSLHPKSVLKRGYSITRKGDNGRIVRRASQLATNENIRIQFYQGNALSKVLELETNDE